MRLEERIRRLERVVQPQNQVFITRFCHRCGWTEKETPPDFEGIAYQIVEFAHCHDQVGTSDETHITSKPAT